MKKILFLIHDLGQGGAEKVLVNLVNHMNLKKFDITVLTLFGGGVNEQFLRPEIHYKYVFRRNIIGNSRLMKLLSPVHLHRLCIKEKYDIEVAYLEGPSARVISGCQDSNTKLISWIHCTFTSERQMSLPFRSCMEAKKCYKQFDNIVCVSDLTKKAFQDICPELKNVLVQYNTIDSKTILEKSIENVPQGTFSKGEISIITVGTMKPVKAFDRLIRIHQRLKEKEYPVHTYFLGEGPEKDRLYSMVTDLGLEKSITFLGYETNPYRFVSKSDIFVCCSYSEGFSTAATEALIVGTPVCTVDVSGMKEMLGENNEYGIVTENNEDALYLGIKQLLDDKDLLSHYQKQAQRRGQIFKTDRTVLDTEELLLK